MLSFVLLACVISGSEYKDESLRWLDEAICLINKLGYHSEARISADTPSLQQMSLGAREMHEERRRTFWLVYSVERHLSFCFNRSLRLRDSECQVLHPLPEWIWQNLDTTPLEVIPPRSYGPLVQISGSSFFEFFLPLMAILGGILDSGLCPEDTSSDAILEKLLQCEQSIQQSLKHSPNLDIEVIPGANIIPQVYNATATRQFAIEQPNHLVLAYSQYMIHVFCILLYVRSSTNISRQRTGYPTSRELFVCRSSATAAVNLLPSILRMDPSLSLMPFLFGIYLLHGSLQFLLLGHTAQMIPDASVTDAKALIIQAHEALRISCDTASQVRKTRKLHQLCFCRMLITSSETMVM